MSPSSRPPPLRCVSPHCVTRSSCCVLCAVCPFRHAKPYTAYNMTMVTITPDGARSDPTAMAFDWSTLPKDYQGVVSRPSVTPADYAKHYGLDTASSAMDKSAPGAAAATQSVAEFYFQFMNVDDLMKYQKM